MNTTKKIDRRTVDRYMDKGQIKRSDFDSYMKALPDDAANATWVQMDLEETEISGRTSGSSDQSGDTEGA